MKKMLVLLVMLLMVGCEAKESEKPKRIIKEAIKQEQQVEQPKEEVEFTKLNFLIKNVKYKSTINIIYHLFVSKYFIIKFFP